MANSFTDQAKTVANSANQEAFDDRMKALKVDNPKDAGFELLNLEQLKAECDTEFADGVTGAIKIKYFLKAEAIQFARYRLLGTYFGHKYHQIPQTPVYIYEPPGFDLQLNNIDVPLIITEGEFKGYAGNRLGAIPTLALGGVNSFSVRLDGTRCLLEPLNSLPPAKRIYITFDYDHDGVNNAPGEPKEQVKAAEQTLAALLHIRGCQVYIIRLAQKNATEKVGLDDYIIRHHASGLQELMRKAREFRPNKQAGESYLLATYGVMSGDLINIHTANTMHHNKFAIDEANCLNPYGSENTDNTPPIQKFLRSPNRTQIRTKVYNPRYSQFITPDYECNTWRGWKTKPTEDLKGIQHWYTYLDFFFRLEPALKYHFEIAHAHMFQKPWVKQNRLLILACAINGVGKSFYFETIAAVINNSIKGVPYGKFNHALVTNGEAVLGKDFNSQLASINYLVLNEIGERGEKHTNFLKDLASGNTISINEKYTAPWACANVILPVITTNEHFTHEVRNTSRREVIYGIPKIDPLCAELRDYFAGDKGQCLFAWINSPKGRSALLHHYLTMDLGDYDGQGIAPDSLAKQRMIKASTNPIPAYVESMQIVGDYIRFAKIRAALDISPNSQLDKLLKTELRDNGWDEIPTIHSVARVSEARVGRAPKELVWMRAGTQYTPEAMREQFKQDDKEL